MSLQENIGTHFESFVKNKIVLVYIPYSFPGVNMATRADVDGSIATLINDLSLA